jgi:aryl-alcohol dehydrogenase-like predicted oxidoreductase
VCSSDLDLAKSPRGNGVRDYMNPRGFAVLDALQAVAAEHGATMAQVALAWQMARPSITAPIASATSVAQLQELMGAAFVRLTPAQMARLDDVSAVPAAP